MDEKVDVSIAEEQEASASPHGKAVFWFLALALSSLMMLYAVTRAFVWDEGYHLVAAQQISLGKLPYIDFCFPQTPLNAFVNAAIIHFFGQHWQPIHVVAALFVLGSALLTAQYLLKCFPDPRWRWACASCAIVFILLNEVVMQFAPIGQAYAISMFFMVAAYRVALATPARVSNLLPYWAGLFAGIAAGCSLLSAPTAIVILVWIWKYDRVGLPWRKGAACVAGVISAFLPVIWLFFKGPDQTFFNVFRYHALYRSVDWPFDMAAHHNLLVFTSLPDSSQGMALAILFVVGVIYLLTASTWSRWLRADFYLAAWIAAVETAYLCTPFPTFGRYFLLITPFATVVAIAGVYAIANKLGYVGRPALATGLAAGLMALMFLPFTVQTWDQTTWHEYEKIAKKVAEVTPKGGRIFADELVYFILAQSPPSGMECSYTHALKLPPAEERRQHLISDDELRQQLANHQFDTVQSCSDDEMDKYEMPGPYRYRADIDDCSVYWGRVTK